MVIGKITNRFNFLYNGDYKVFQSGCQALLKVLTETPATAAILDEMKAQNYDLSELEDSLTNPRIRGLRLPTDYDARMYGYLGLLGLFAEGKLSVTSACFIDIGSNNVNDR